jgi:hypothetical protein
MWQVKSSNDSGSSGGSGEIQKIKLCIVRPSETLEPSPRKRKRYEVVICLCVLARARIIMLILLEFAVELHYFFM